MRLIDADALLEKKQALLTFGGAEVIWIYSVSVAPTIDPIKAAGGCRCGECKYRNTCDHTIRIVPGGPEKGCLHGNLHGCEYGVVGKPMEAQDDG